MSKIPKGWEIKKLGDVCSYDKNQTFIKICRMLVWNTSSQIQECF